MKKFSRAVLAILFSVCMQSCASYFAGQGTIGMKSLTEGSTDNDELLTSFNKGVTISYDIKGKQATIENHSDKTLYIDKAKSFYVNNTGGSTSLFSNAVTTVSSSSTSGGTVNLGAVAGALGVRGPVGALANGINVGGATSNSVSNQIIEQQYVVIPPNAKQYINIPGKEYYYAITGTDTKTKDYSYEESPIKCQYYISYAFEDNGKLDFQYIKDGFYLSNESIEKGKFVVNPYSSKRNNYIFLSEEDYDTGLAFMWWSMSAEMAILLAATGPGVGGAILCAGGAAFFGFVGYMFLRSGKELRNTCCFTDFKL